MFAGFFCLIVGGIVLSTASHADFVGAYNGAVTDAGGTMLYQDTIDTVAGEGVALTDGMKPDFDIYATLALFPAVAWPLRMGIRLPSYAVKSRRPQRNIVLGQVLAALIPGFFLSWFAVGLVNVMGQDFMGAIAWMENTEKEQHTTITRWPSFNTFYLISLLTGNTAVQFLIGLVFILFDVLWMPISYIAFSRAAFAWGMDRLGPMWFTDVNPKVSLASQEQYPDARDERNRHCDLCYEWQIPCWELSSLPSKRFSAWA